MRGRHDDDPVDWWFASTAIPILAATLGPLANVLSIGALVTFWRLDLRDPTDPTAILPQLKATPIRDPRWCYWINVSSLILGFVGNFFLLLNFTNRIRYIISLPLTILLWFLSCGILIGDLAAMHVYARPVAPIEAYSGGYWYGIAAASFYFLLASLLLVNLLGYIRGHYPQHFDLTEDQRTLIIQTMFYFIWLAGGGGVYARLEGWHFIDAAGQLYYCDVTILTIGFGDLYPTKTAARALLIPFSLGGIIMLGLVVSSIYRSVQERIRLLRDEKERFQAMRRLQQQAKLWKNWWRLSLSLSLFTVFWCIGAVVFWEAEVGATGQTYWETVYFCWVAILSIGYGDFSPKSGAGRCFFVIWSVIAVPSITMLASDLTATFVSAFNNWSSTLADFTILPKEGIWTALVDKHPWLSLEKAEQSSNGSTSKEDAYAAGLLAPDFEALVTQHDADLHGKQPDAAALARHLALAIRRTAHDLTLDKPRNYQFEEWVEFTRLIRFSVATDKDEVMREEEEEGLVQWDWIGENSPMVSDQTESEFVLDRLCESLVRYLKRNPPAEPFASTVKERGEEALRLRTAAMDEERNFVTRSSSSKDGPVEMQSSKAALRPLPEEEHE
ncbi:uncharacterized protein BDR25DRAFT_283290 [Lindgomyces ingoldianus]|uniref:Uncharacterized protein n=1 Tax=Lindgomyces ingoldianus TaxID=673940 RepID=A0ACB6R0B8_9PLEO|nr:uncharacterized protein BDR25DRAFT_283290 [Lindgomyces ingoldianus]KAF2472759.1 hypothetical protein BDR25DRAFT_283290 [Lindgomyces ingoldianus]